MPLKLTMAEAPRRLTRLPAELRRGARSDVAIITDNGEPVLAILSWKMYDGLLETLEILGDHGQMQRYARAFRMSPRDGQNRGRP